MLSLAACSMHTTQNSDGENRRESLWNSSRIELECGRPRHESSIAKNRLLQKPDWNTSARAHDATPEFPQILARGSELTGECDESVSTIIHRKCFLFHRVADSHFGATVLSQVQLCILLACQSHSVVWYSACYEHEGMKGIHRPQCVLVTASSTSRWITTSWT